MKIKEPGNIKQEYESKSSVTKDQTSATGMKMLLLGGLILCGLIILVYFLFFKNNESMILNKNESSLTSEQLKSRELDLKERELELKQKELQERKNVPADYNNSGTKGNYPEASLVVLTDSDLQNKNAWELRIMRNEVFARYGYIFKLPELREYFLKQDWYVPKFEDVSGMLTGLEKENIEKIKRYEAYIGSKYNGYSR